MSSKTIPETLLGVVLEQTPPVGVGVGIGVLVGVGVGFGHCPGGDPLVQVLFTSILSEITFVESARISQPVIPLIIP